MHIAFRNICCVQRELGFKMHLVLRDGAPLGFFVAISGAPYGAVGTDVVLCGLRTHSTLNGRRGRVVSSDAGGGNGERVAVYIAGEAGPFAVRPQNMAPAHERLRIDEAARDAWADVLDGMLSSSLAPQAVAERAAVQSQAAKSVVSDSVTGSEASEASTMEREEGERLERLRDLSVRRRRRRMR